MNDKSIKVLLVEDNPGDARLIREFLFDANKASFEIEVAERLSDGLEALSARTFDVILLDLSLPDSSGLDTLLKAHAKAPQVPIIVLTGLDDEMVTIGALRKGAQDYLVKGQLNGELLSRAVRYSIERKHTEEALRKSEERFRYLSESSPIGVFETDKNGSVQYLNNKWLTITGMSLQNALGFGWAEALHSEDRPRILAEWEKCLEENRGYDGEFRFVRPSGEVRWVRTRTSPVISPAGDVISYVGVNEDITESKLAEQGKKRLEAQLAHAQKMEAIGTLAGGVAHDLNNILSGLVSYPELILMDLPEDNHLRKPIQTILKSGQKAAAIVQDLLTLARRGVAVTEPININEIITEYLRSPEYEKLKSFHPNVQSEINLESDLSYILGSPIHLSKAIMNLVSNAAEAMPDGGKISISTENQYIDRPIKGYDDIEEGDYVLLIVSDAGIGIASDDTKKIFEPFYTKKVMGRSGTGLGMAVVWGTVKDHKGYIDIESTEGEGTTFTIYFPVTREEPVKDESLLSIDDYMGRGESVLVVDDVAEQREIASKMLIKLGYSVTSVPSGEEAVEYLRNNSTDLLVLDMIMAPGIDGFDTYKRILQLHPGQKAIMASGFSETDRVKEAQKLGAGAYIRKPYTMGKIGLAIKKELEK